MNLRFVIVGEIMELMKRMQLVKRHKKIIMLLLAAVWLLYISVNMLGFQATSNLTDVVGLSDTEHNYEEYTEFEGELQARQYRIHSFEIRLKKKAKPQKIDVFIIDEGGKNITSCSYVPQKKAKKFTITDEVYIKKHGQYRIIVQVYDENSLTASSCKVYYNAFLKLDYMAAVLASFMAVFILLWDIIHKRGYLRKEKAVSLLTLVLIGVQAGVAFWTVEHIFQNDIAYHITSRIILLNLGCYLAVYLVMLFILNSAKWSVLLCNFFFIVWGLANQYVYLFKGQALMPVDLKSIRTAASVASEYDYTLTPEMRLALSVMILFTVLWVRGENRKLVVSASVIKRFFVRIPGLILGTVVCWGLMKSSFIPNMGMNLDMWDSRNSFHENGTFLSFWGYWHLMQVEKPESYTPDGAAEIAESAEKKIVETDEMQPNIVVVMNEAFADLSYYGEFETNIPYLENYNSIKENAIKGYALVNIIGGGTANSEFEYLTGHSLTFMSSSIPFAQHIQEKHDSIASNLSMQGYDTTAIHPLHGVNWRRNVVYPYLGFDDFIAMEDMDKMNAEYVRQFISDGYTYELVMDILKENSDAPDFVFDVTVQNHSGYTYAKEDFEEEVWVEGYDSMEVSQYLTLIKKSDEALGTFIRQLETFSEPTILVFLVIIIHEFRKIFLHGLIRKILLHPWRRFKRNTVFRF